MRKPLSISLNARYLNSHEITSAIVRRSAPLSLPLYIASLINNDWNLAPRVSACNKSYIFHDNHGTLLRASHYKTFLRATNGEVRSIIALVFLFMRHVRSLRECIAPIQYMYATASRELRTEIDGNSRPHLHMLEIKARSNRVRLLASDLSTCGTHRGWVDASDWNYETYVIR